MLRPLANPASAISVTAAPRLPVAAAPTLQKSAVGTDEYGR